MTNVYAGCILYVCRMYFIGGRFEKRPYRGLIPRVYSGSE